MNLKYKYEKSAFANLITKDCLNGKVDDLLNKLIPKSKEAVKLKEKVGNNNRIKNWRRYYFDTCKCLNLYINDEKIIMSTWVRVRWNKQENRFVYFVEIVEMWAFGLYWYLNAGFFGTYHGKFTYKKKYWMSPGRNIPPKRSWSTGIIINIPPIIETAWKEGWLLIATNYRFDIHGETLPKKFGLPTFSRKELHKLKTFINHRDYSMYIDYITMGNQLHRNWSHENYFRNDWKEEHQRHINIINRQKEEDRILHDKKKSVLKKLKDNPVFVYQPKNINDLKEIGRKFNNCIGSAYKNPEEIRIYKVKEEPLAVRIVDNKVCEARFNYNLEANQTIYKKLQLQLKKEAMQSLKATQERNL